MAGSDREEGEKRFWAAVAVGVAPTERTRGPWVSRMALVAFAREANSVRRPCIASVGVLKP